MGGSFGQKTAQAISEGAEAGGVRFDCIEREGAEIAAGRGRDRRAVRVGEVEVGEADRARGGVERAAAGAGGQLADRAVAVGRASRRGRAESSGGAGSLKKKKPVVGGGGGNGGLLRAEDGTSDKRGCGGRWCPVRLYRARRCRDSRWAGPRPSRCACR